LIEHKEIVVACEEKGPVSMSYNVLLTTPKANARVKHVVPVVIAKSTLACTNCGKIDNLVETCHNIKKEVLVVPTTIIKSLKPIAITKTQPIKLGKILICYPYIICFNVEHIFGECPQKIEVQNMFKTKLVNSNAITTSKLPKIDNVPVNVVACYHS
jgi:hypothetical protein